MVALDLRENRSLTSAAFCTDTETGETGQDTGKGALLENGDQQGVREAGQASGHLELGVSWYQSFAVRRGCCGCICLGNGAGSKLQQGLWAVQHGVIWKDQGMTKCTL